MTSSVAPCSSFARYSTADQMSQAKPTLFLVGTGFIGGTLLTSLLEQGKYEIAALSRDEAKANKLKELGVRPVMGSLDDDILAEESEKADVSLFREALADEFVLDPDLLVLPRVRTDHHPRRDGR